MRDDPDPPPPVEPSDVRAQPPPWFYNQSAAVPVRREAGLVEVLLVTSRSCKRWVVPKGVIEPGMSPAESAEKEAWEEAGVRGTMRPTPLGIYHYEKWGGTCRVEVYVLDVEEVDDVWPEQTSRRRWWLKATEAAEVVTEDDLAAMVRSLAGEGATSGSPT